MPDIVDPTRPYTHEALLRDCGELLHAYPGILKADIAGFSREGREIPLLMLGEGPRSVFLCGAHHGREYLTAAFLMKMAEQYAAWQREGAPTDEYDTAGLLSQIRLHIVPMVNPDGVEICLRALSGLEPPEGIRSMRLLGKDYTEWKSNAAGVDLNRQYPCLWERLGGPTAPASELYKGESPASEPEVQVVMRLCEKNRYTLSAAFHTKGEEIYWADSLTRRALPQAKPLARALARLTGYRLMHPSADPAVYAGGFENWFRMRFIRPAFLLELTPYDHTGHPHDDRQFYELTRWQKTSLAGLLLLKAAQGLP